MQYKMRNAGRLAVLLAVSVSVALVVEYRGVWPIIIVVILVYQVADVSEQIFAVHHAVVVAGFADVL